MLRSPPVLWSVLPGALLLLNAAPAASQQYFGEDLGSARGAGNAASARDDFLSNLSGWTTEDFESYSPVSRTRARAMSTMGPDLTAASSGNVTLTGEAAVNHNGDGHASRNNRQATSGSQFLDFRAEEFTLTFRDPIHAFGFYGIDVGDFGRRLFVTLTRASSATETIEVPHTVARRNGQNTGALLFFGLIDAADPFTSVTFHRDAVGDIFAFDDFVYGTTAAVPTAVAPEPVSMLLLGTGLVGVVAVRRRRRVRD